LAGVADAARADAGLSADVMGPKLSTQLGIRGPGLRGGNSGDLYIDDSLSPADQKRLLDAAVAAYRAHPQVAAVFTAAEIAASPMPSGRPDQLSLLERVRESYYPGRSGDLYVVLKKDITPIPDTSHGFVATHGSPGDYDRRVPVLVSRPGRPGANVQG